MLTLDTLQTNTLRILQMHARLLHVRSQTNNLRSDKIQYQELCNALQQCFTEARALFGSNNSDSMEAKNIMQSLTSIMIVKEQQWYADINQSQLYSEDYMILDDD